MDKKDDLRAITTTSPISARNHNVVMMWSWLDTMTVICYDIWYSVVPSVVEDYLATPGKAERKYRLDLGYFSNLAQR